MPMPTPCRRLEVDRRRSNPRRDLGGDRRKSGCRENLLPLWEKGPPALPEGGWGSAGTTFENLTCRFAKETTPSPTGERVRAAPAEMTYRAIYAYAWDVRSSGPAALRPR